MFHLNNLKKKLTLSTWSWEKCNDTDRNGFSNHLEEVEKGYSDRMNKKDI